MDNFYTVLPSNTPIEGNKTSNYKVRLPEPLNLDSSWTVALSSIIYPISFTSLGTQEDQFITINKEEGGEEKISIPAMNFLSISNLEKGINDAILAYTKGTRTTRSILENEGPLRTPEKIQETPEIIAAVEEFKKKKEQGKSGRVEEKPKESEAAETGNLGEQANRIEDEKKILSAKRAIERAWQQCVSLATEIENLANLARAKRQKSELQRRRFPTVGQELYNELSTLVHTIQDRAVLIAEEAKIAANAKNKIVEFMQSRNAAEARKVADIAKKAEQDARTLGNEASRLFAGTQERNFQDGVEQLANRIEFLINSVAGPSEAETDEITKVESKIDRPLPEPQYPPGHPKLQEEPKIDKDALNTKKDSEVKALEKIEESPEIIGAVEEFKRKKEQEGILKEQLKPKETERITPLTNIEEKPDDTREVNILERNKLNEVHEEKSKELEKKKTQSLPLNESSDEEYELLKINSPPIKDEKKVEKKIENIWSLNENEEPVIELFPTKKVTEHINKKSEPIRIKGFYIPDQEEEENLSLLPELPKPLALVSNVESERDLTIPEQAHRSLMNRLKKISRLAKTPSDNLQRVQFKYDNVYQKFTVLMQRNIKSIQISKQLAYILGFRTNINIQGGDMAEYMPDLSGGVKQLYIYAPKLIENTMVGDQSVPLLRVINVQGNPGEIVESIYSAEFHHRLQSKRITEITIEIRTSSGELVNFHWGNLILTLHWKRSFF